MGFGRLDHKLLATKKRQAFGLTFFASAMMFSSPVLADKSEQEAPKAPAAINEKGLSNAAEALSNILADAKKSGLVVSKQSTPVLQGGTQTVSSKPNEPERLTCATSEILNFQALQDIASYDSLSAGKSLSMNMEGEYKALYIARLYITLGLGEEAKAALTGFKSKEVELLRRAAELVSDIHYDVKTPVIDSYAECSPDLRIWSLIENPYAFSRTISGEERRAIIRALDDFPPMLKELLSVNIATKAAESDEFPLAQAIWNKMDSEAREAEKRLPEDRIERHDFLYLKGLINQKEDPDLYLSILNYLSEREGVFRLTALTRLSKINRNSTAPINKNLEDDLIEVSQTFTEGYETQLAAMELVKNRIYRGQASEAITAAKQYFEPTDAQYRQSVVEISNLVEEKLKSENKIERLIGLNDYLFDPDFFYDSETAEALKLKALNIAMASGLPEIHDKIFDPNETYSKVVTSKIEQAKFFTDLKNENFESVPKSQLMPSSLSFEDGVIKTVALRALMNNDLPLANNLASKIPDIEERNIFLNNIAWVESRWEDTDAKKSDIVDVLNTPTTPAFSAFENDWATILPRQLSAIQNTVEKSQTYLKEGFLTNG